MFYETKNRYDVLTGVQVARWAGHIVSVDGRPAVVAGMTIVPNIDMGLLQGTPNLLLSITYIDEEFISQIGRSLLLPDLALGQTPIQGAVSEPFLSDDGVQEGYLSWTSRQPGRVLLTIILPLVALGVILTWLLSKIMFGRLKRASAALAQREFEARHEAKHDALSGLPNRGHMVDKIEKFLNSYIARRNGQRALSAYIDIDRFKDVNDTLGHEAGDELIKLVAHRLSTRLRPNDFLARFGGDEFVILCAPAGTEAGESLIERIQEAFQSPYVIKGQTLNVTASVGLAVAPDNGSTADELMRHADIALYEAKSQGRDRAIYFNAKMAEEVEHRRSIELDLRAAMENEELDLHYQPVISCSTGAVVGVEALLRWQHPLYGSMPPAEFIPVAENAGLLPVIGEWVLDRAMTDAKLWPDLEVAVNLSPVQFRHVGLEAMLQRLIVKHAAEPNRFVLEITEGVLLEATDRVNMILDAIREMGFKTALDDFGTGYSSLSSLQAFPFNKIKIARELVEHVSDRRQAELIVKSVLGLGKSLGIPVLAEGVETHRQMAFLRSLDCQEVQGYYFARPASADDILPILTEGFSKLPEMPDNQFDPGSVENVTSIAKARKRASRRGSPSAA